ncbi:HAD family hydrolase [Embleya scabrispora]|uniref:HAD family hydrolase n=1 Tax=Embleya scabrispora TaxID=159449 RepID=UPI000377330F|nr:HAD family hydrolase [Embleya scabrispora]MYS78829.1 HAD-IA family hydrolase [Streptomyces sp. SID5474]
MIESVVFDVGETLTNDARFWGRWAEWVGVPAHTMSALVGAVTALGMDNAEALRRIRPGFDLAAERAASEAAGVREVLEESDLYPDVRPALAGLRAAGVWVGIAGNQTRRAGEMLRALRLPADALAVSEEWGVAKPDDAFFRRLIEWAPGEPHEILYVGDHPANDHVPAARAGLRTALVRRGPWGYLWAGDPEVNRADWTVDSLSELADLIGR